MNSLGLTVEEATIIRAVVAIVSIFTPIVVGMIGDRLGNYKVVYKYENEFNFNSSWFIINIFIEFYGLFVFTS